MRMFKLLDWQNLVYSADGPITRSVEYIDVSDVFPKSQIMHWKFDTNYETSQSLLGTGQLLFCIAPGTKYR